MNYNKTNKDNFSNSNNGKFDKKFDKSKDGKKPFNKFKEEKPKTIFDRAFVDPDKEKKKKELDALRPQNENTFSKSLDDIENPKYGNTYGNAKAGFTKKQFSKIVGEGNEARKFNDDYKKSRSFSKDSNKDSFKRIDRSADNEKRPFNKKSQDTDRKNNFKSGNRYDSKDSNRFSNDKKFSKSNREDKPFKKFDNNKPGKDKPTKPESSHPFQKFDHKSEDFKNRFTPFREQHKAYASERDNGRKKFERQDRNLEKNIAADYNTDAKMPLNKYIARSGVCSRRDAVDCIKNGEITVNNNVINEPGYKVQELDVVRYKNKVIRPERDFVYILLNKPKGYITTLDDPKGRRTVADLFADEIQERIFPVGRLDRNTTGLLLLTNDGDLAQQLAHPKYEIKKVYQVKLDKPVAEADIIKIKNGLPLEDGVTQVDHIAYLDAADEIGIEIHSGKNRIVRRIFEHLNYQVEKLDRVYYAGLTKKNLPKGSFRKLTRQEVINLKYLGKKKKNIEH